MSFLNIVHHITSTCSLILSILLASQAIQSFKTTPPPPPHPGSQRGI
jgi:hypothetical protein